MSLEFNIFQGVFLVAYSILYGVMLQNMSSLKSRVLKSRFQPFPWQQAFKDRSMCLRLLCSIVVLNVLPFLYAILVLSLLGKWTFYDSWSHGSWLLILLTFFTGLGVFGFQRFYGFLAIAARKYGPRLLASALKEVHYVMEEQVKGSLSLRASVISVFYYFVPVILLLFGWAFS